VHVDVLLVIKWNLFLKLINIDLIIYIQIYISRWLLICIWITIERPEIIDYQKKKISENLLNFQSGHKPIFTYLN